MLINQLSVSYKCHSSIGNSLELKSMVEEAIKIFVTETDALFGAFYLLENKNHLIYSHGKEMSYFIDELLYESNDEEVLVKTFNEFSNILLFKLSKSFIFLVYDKSVNLEFLSSMFESFRAKLNISVDSCLNVKKLKEKNIELENLTLSLKEKVENAVYLAKEKERQFFEQLKMAQMGELIGNIAHQWRQPLSVISTAASGMMLKKETNFLTDEDFYYYANNILNNATFLSKTIDEFRDYIKESNKEKLVVIQDRVKMALKMVENSYSLDNIKIKTDFIESDPIKFKLNLGELLQVLIAILNNAREALSVSKNKEKWIKYSIFKDNYNVSISIEDNAGGIDETIMDKIFNPYFTTKHQTQGTGIGLYSSYNIVVNHLSGNLDVENTEFGAKFCIKLPLHSNYSI